MSSISPVHPIGTPTAIPPVAERYDTSVPGPPMFLGPVPNPNPATGHNSKGSAGNGRRMPPSANAPFVPPLTLSYVTRETPTSPKRPCDNPPPNAAPNAFDESAKLALPVIRVWYATLGSPRQACDRAGRDSKASTVISLARRISELHRENQRR